MMIVENRLINESCQIWWTGTGAKFSGPGLANYLKLLEAGTGSERFSDIFKN
jgi:hypothetical protein